MRFPILTKATLLAAGLFVATAALLPAQTITSAQTKIDLNNGSVLSDDEKKLYGDLKGLTTILDSSNGAFTVGGAISGEGNLVIRGGNPIELNVYGEGPETPDKELREVYKDWAKYELWRFPKVENGALVSIPDIREINWSHGGLVISEGDVKFGGILNLPLNYGKALNVMIEDFPAEGKISGVDFIRLVGSSSLSVVGNSYVPGGFIYLNNLQALPDNSQEYATLYVGEGSAHVDLHVDAYDGTDETLQDGGSIGFISGKASVYKTGSGNFKLLEASSHFSGAFYAAGGNLILSAPETASVEIDAGGILDKYGYDYEYGRTLWTAESLTIAGTEDVAGEYNQRSSLSEASRLGALSRPGEIVLPYNKDDKKQIVYYKSANFSTPEAGTVVIANNQVIRNFQAMFANGVAATDSNQSAASAIQNAADKADSDAPIIAGTGAGSYLAVKEDAVLAIYQEEGMGGIYKGTICGVGADGVSAGINSQTGALAEGGTIVKYGKGDLALILEGANYKKLALLEGDNIYTNVATLDLDIGSYNWGSGEWDRETGLFISGDVGNFTIVENEAATLAMRLETENIHFSTYASVETLGGEIDFSNERKPGYIELSAEQRFITGEVYVENGMTLILTAEDFVGEAVDLDGDGAKNEYRYFDVNGIGAYEDERGDKHAVKYYKNLATGERVYYYEDSEGKKQLLAGKKFTFKDSIEFSGGSLGNAKAVILKGKTENENENIRSTLAFNNTNQKVNNLTGDEWSQVRLGASTLTVNITDAGTYSTYQGAISGVGNIVKTGNEKWTLGGGSSLSYMGATVLAGGSINATKSRSLWNSSAILMNAGTAIQFSGAQDLVSLIGGNANVALSNGELRLGMDASRRDNLEGAFLSEDYREEHDVFGAIITDDLGNSERTLDTYSGETELVSDYLSPLLDFEGKTVSYTDKDGKVQTREVLSVDQAEALTQYFLGETPNDDAMKALFGRSVGSGELTVADIMRLYARLTAETQFGATFDKNGKLESADLNEMLDRLSFNGKLTADSIVKIGDDRATLAGTVNVKSASILAGTLEIDADAVEKDKDGNPIAFSGGVTIHSGATFAINTNGIKGDSVFEAAITGDGNFEKHGDGHLILSDKAAYLGETTVFGGDLTMTLHGETDETYEQGDIFVEKDSSVLTFAQAEKLQEEGEEGEKEESKDVVWNGKLKNKGSLVKTGKKMLSLTNAPEIGKNLSVEAGTLVLVNAEISGNEGYLSVAEGATLELSESESAVIDRAFEGVEVAVVGADGKEKLVTGSGTLVKSGTGELTLQTTHAGKAGDKFSGTLSVASGVLALATKNIFASGVSVDVAEGAMLRVNKTQTFGMLSGHGDVEINANEPVVLGIMLNNKNALGYSNGSGSYVAMVNGKTGTDYVETFKPYSYEGTIRAAGSETGSSVKFGGNGAFVLNPSYFDSKLELQIGGKATVVTTYLGELNYPFNVVVSDGGRFVLDSGASENGEFFGTISGTAGRVVGKIGSGKLALGAATVSDAKLEVLEGTLSLKGSDAFSFNSAVVVKGAILELSYTGDAEKDLVLTQVEGSGTVRLTSFGSTVVGNIVNLNATSVLAPTPNKDGRYFDGILDAGSFKINVSGSGVELCSLETTGGFYSDGTKERVKIYQENDTTIGGEFSGNIEVTGEGRLTITSENATGTILVNDGKVELSAAAKSLNNDDVVGGVRVQNNASIYFAGTTSVKNTLSSVEVRLAQEGASVGRVELVKTGDDTKTLNFTDEGRVMLGVSETLWAKFSEPDSGNAKLFLGVEQGRLEVSGLSKLSKSVNLLTQGEGTFVVLAEQAPETLDRAISGTGNVAFTGKSGATVSVDQAYTGATTLEAESTVAFSNVSLATSTFTVESGATQKGGVKLVGAKTRSAAAEPAVGGNLVNNGEVILNVANGDVIEYAGTFANSGKIKIEGAGATKRGNEIVLFKSLSGKNYTTQEMERLFGSGKLTNNKALMVVQNNGVISAFSVGDSFAETSGLREGLAGSFTDVLDDMGGVDDAEDGIVFEKDLQDRWGSVGVALNRVSEDSLAADIANLSPLGMASMVAMSRSSFANDWDALTSRMAHRRYDTGNTLMENGPEFFAQAQATLVENADNSDSANYNFNTYGAIVGMDMKPNDYSLYGAALAYDYGSAKIHDGGGKIYSDSIRAMLFASTLLGDESYFLDGGVYCSVNLYEAERETLVGGTKGDTEGWNVGASATFGKGFLLSKDTDTRLLATPYVGIAYQYSRVNAFDESGTAALDVDSFDAHSLLGRLGATLDWQFPLGDYEARVSLDVAYSHEFMDDTAEIEAAFESNDEKFCVDGTIGSSDVFSFSPSMTVDLSEHNSVFFGYSLEYGTNEQIGHSVNAGFRRSF